MSDTDLDMLKEVKEHCAELEALHAQRNIMFDAMEKLVLMTADEQVKSKYQNVKHTISPDPRNKLIGARRLLTATDPIWSVPLEKNSDDVEPVASKIEKAAARLWQAAGRVRQMPVHYDVVLSALTFAEMQIAITKTSDLLKQAKGGSKAAVAKAEEIADRTPFLFDVWDPRTGYPEFGSAGLTSYFRKVDTTVGRVLDDFGDAARLVLPMRGNGYNRFEPVTLCQFWDYEYRHVWLDQYTLPLLQEKHGLPFIPVICQLGEGSLLFEKPEQQRQPFHYGVWKSDLWERQNLALTVLYTIMFAVGSNPLFIYKSNDPEKTINPDWDTPGGVLTIMQGEEFQSMAKQVIDPSFMQGLEIANELIGESTIYAQTLGEPLGGNAPFSMVALLHQAGRLPLLISQRTASWAIADTVKTALLWAKEEGLGGGYSDLLGDLTTKEIPKKFELEATLEIALPQDKGQQAQTARALTEGDKPLASRRYAREEHLGIEQPDEMQAEIWAEDAADLFYRKFATDQAAVIAQQFQQFMMSMAPGQQPPGMPPGQPPMQGPPQMPPEQMQPPMQPGMQQGPPQGPVDYTQQGVPPGPPNMPPMMPPEEELP